MWPSTSSRRRRGSTTGSRICGPTRRSWRWRHRADERRCLSDSGGCVKHLTKQQVEILKRRLLEVRREILGDVEKSKRHSKESGDDGTQDIADMAGDTYSRQG